jgi:hypothetical protein
VLYFDSQEQADAFMSEIPNDTENLRFEDCGDGKVRVIY